MGIVFLREIAEQLREVIACIKCIQFPGQHGKSFGHTGLDDEVQSTRRFAEEDDTAHGQEVKCRFKVGLEASASLGQSPHFTKFACIRSDNATGLTEISEADNQGLGTLGSHKCLERWITS